jgi:lysozyme family protein
MTTYTKAYEAAVDHAMLYEVGGFWKLTPEVEAGLCDTPARRKATGYVNDPDDAGGETKFGVAKNANQDIDIKAMTWEDAKAVYYKRYWLAGSCDKMPARLAVLHFDGCVNHGVKRAGMFLQRAVGATPDGDVGPVTLSKVATAHELESCAKICDLRAQFYRDIVTNKPTQAKFLNGWLRRINEMRTFVLDTTRSFD